MSTGVPEKLEVQGGKGGNQWCGDKNVMNKLSYNTSYVDSG